MRQRPWGNDASAYRTPCSPCPVRHTQCDTRMTDYAALKLTEMFVGVERQSLRGAACALAISWSRWRSLVITVSAFRIWRASRRQAASQRRHIARSTLTAGRGGLRRRRRLSRVAPGCAPTRWGAVCGWR
ncbi:hypothetical protein XarbCFBP7408_15475 [Xanthomonas arboricola pv. guizotiae]|uniref:Uncharacterized protein n=1 Tax=Xanthomonas arboricola pv. guizotiae TaxID=487867 RepID=A0A2S6ZTM4_9XANT|nr:hypothetical protein XarbCFBP7409_16840 [Xanthomonas arboricola pv. guizotiae]PPU22396.1 hypothetical protein XarbCFBP7408_15475 [Xanthomonas arboricola pv. guizotiae]